MNDINRSLWDLGLTSFGGPPSHFRILHRRFVERLKWIDEESYNELFALTQATPGPASTKLLYCIAWFKGGFPCAALAMMFWILPGAAGMYGLASGVSRIGEVLPAPVYALLSGLNAATVGIIALAAVQLSERAITDNWTRFLVFVGGAAGLLYTALWYFPAMIAGAAVSTLIWDLQVTQRWLRRARSLALRRTVAKTLRQPTPDQAVDQSAVELGTMSPRVEVPSPVFLRRHPQGSVEAQTQTISSTPASPAQVSDGRQANMSTARTGPPMADDKEVTSPAGQEKAQPVLSTGFWKAGLIGLLAFLAFFIAIILLRARLDNMSRLFALFANMLLAGVLIFGGGPVVIPLLREYVVAEGWVSQRDFLLGLALIQAWPGPNFNFAVYLGALAVQGTSAHSLAGATIALLGIFSPGFIIVTSFTTFWRTMRKMLWIRSILRGINAVAVGLVYTAVYRLWQIGYVIDGASKPLGTDPFFVAITATSYVGGRYAGFDAFFAILLGGVMGLLWYAAVKT